MQSIPPIPKNTQILVIGGGPSGSYAAACLAREGMKVVLLEKSKFPRYHIGESMLPSMRNFLRFIELEKKFDSFGFQHKNGGAFQLRADMSHGVTDFLVEGKNNYSWNVVRSDSDELMLRHAAECGASVFEETTVSDVVFEGGGTSGRPKTANWINSRGIKGEIEFEFLVDASGRTGLLSKQLKTRQYHPGFKNVAVWGYWRGTSVYNPGSVYADYPFFEALSDQSGWAWFIRLHNGTTSVGFVMNENAAIQIKSQMENSTLTNFYLEGLKQRAPAVLKLIGEGEIVSNDLEPSVRQTSDYSYYSTSYAGEGYRVVGDAAAFIDPYFSSGVHLALSNGLSAAATICASIRNECSEAQAAQWHNSRVSVSYTRFLVVVLTAYMQIKNQTESILSEVDEDNFDRAFNHFSDVIQGKADINQSLSDNEAELRANLSFCKNVLDQAPDALKPKSSDSNAPPLSTSAHSSTPEKKLDVRTKDAISGATARRYKSTGDSFFIDNIVTDSFDGLGLRLQTGNLGLNRV